MIIICRIRTVSLPYWKSMYTYSIVLNNFPWVFTWKLNFLTLSQSDYLQCSYFLIWWVMELPSDYHDRQLTAAFLLNIKIPEIADTFLIFYLTLFLFRLLVTVIVRNSLSLKLVCYHYLTKISGPLRGN